MLVYILFVIGILLLIKSADYLVEGSSSLAKKFGVSSLVIGLTIVAFGTSMPELIVNIMAALQGATEVAFGNIIGSNLSNILLVLGITAILYNVKVHKSTTWKEIPFSLLAVVVLLIVSNKYIIDGIEIFSLTRVDGLILLLFFIIFLYYAFLLVQQNKEKIKEKKLKIPERAGWLIALMIMGGFVGLYFGGKWTVDGAVFIAQRFGLSQFLISATIIAIGTSLPELVTSIRAAMKKNVDLAIGNIVGSNIFNIFWILGVTSLIKPVAIPNFINTDIIILGIATFALFLFMFVGKKHELEKWNGWLFIAAYIAYIVFLIIRG